MPMLVGYHPVGEGPHPEFVDSPARYYLHDDTYEQLRDATQLEFDSLTTVMEKALAEPGPNFKGLRRHDHDESYGICYKDESKSGFIFVVFVGQGKPGLDGLEVIGWGWREEDEDRPGWPKNWKSDFKEPLP